MKTMKRKLTVFENGLKWTLMLAVPLVGLSGMAAEVPAVLPRPDTTPPFATQAAFRDRGPRGGW